MSRPEPRRFGARRIGHALFTLTAFLLVGSMGCWEQWSDTWFPQMKRQKSIQAFESVEFDNQIAPFMPPEGAVPVNPGEAPFPAEDEAAADALHNPRPMSLQSLENGRLLFNRFCAACHGAGGLGDGPVSMTSPEMGPFGGVLPIAGPASIAKVRSDGHIWATIRYGRRRMPSYQRIPEEGRWDVVNYVRYLNDQKGVGQ
ncbi:MAG TPA: cytochrome c [Myxococcota bacterium]|nr:cytochrome c [Myxococcota bacterium]